VTEGDQPPDLEALVRELQAKVAARFEAGEYPPDLEQELKAHFDDLARERRVPDRFVELMRRVDDAAAFSEHRIQLVSSLPGGRRLHGLIAKVVRRQVSGILAQDRLFALAVRDLLAQVIRSLPEEQDGAAATWWDVSEAYQEHLYGPREKVVERLGALAEHLAGMTPVLVAETGRGELLAALGKLGVEAEAVATDPRPELAARADAELGGLGLGMLHGQRLRVPAQGILPEPLCSRLPARSRHIDGQVDRGHHASPQRPAEGRATCPDFAQVGPEVDAHPVKEHARSRHADAEH